MYTKTAIILTRTQRQNASRQGRGVITNVASMLGLIAMTEDTSVPAYIASRHGVVGLTKSDGVHYAPKGIRINALCPGFMATPLVQKTLDAGMMSNAVVTRTPAGRMGVMEEMGDAATFLASQMSSFMFGASLVVDG